MPIEVGAFAETSPLGVREYAYDGRIILIISEDSMKIILLIGQIIR